MNWFSLFFTGLFSVLFVKWFVLPKFAPQEQKPDLQKFIAEMPLWVEVLDTNEQFLVAGRRLSWLPPAEFGHGASILIGAINLEDTDPALRTAIEQHCHPVYLTEHLVLARIIARVTRSENLMMGPLDNPALQQKIESAIAQKVDEIDVLLEVTSGSIGLMDTEESEQRFTEIWRQYVPAWTLLSLRQ